MRPFRFISILNNFKLEMSRCSPCGPSLPADEIHSVCQQRWSNYNSAGLFVKALLKVFWLRKAKKSKNSIRFAWFVGSEKQKKQEKH